MLYERFDSNANLDLHSKRMMHGKADPWDGRGDLSVHADMEDFLDIPMSSLCGVLGSSIRLDQRGMLFVKDSWPFPIFWILVRSLTC
jgi:hypothetical protein